MQYIIWITDGPATQTIVSDEIIVLPISITTHPSLIRGKTIFATVLSGTNFAHFQDYSPRLCNALHNAMVITAGQFIQAPPSLGNIQEVLDLVREKVGDAFGMDKAQGVFVGEVTDEPSELTVSHTVTTAPGIWHITAGGPNWVPAAEDLQTISELFQAAAMDPVGAVVVTRNDVVAHFVPAQNVYQHRKGGKYRLAWVGMIACTDFHDMQLRTVDLTGTSTSVQVRVQTDTPLEGLQLCAVYVALETSAEFPDPWLRPATEFFDGRFTLISQVQL